MIENNVNGYNIDYELLTYPKLQEKLQKIVNNSDNKFPVTKHEPLGKTNCGFDIEHYSIGNGFNHILIFGGCHANEIIGVDYVTQFMNNLAKGNGSFANFDAQNFTIDIIPCLNPEGFATTTYALDSITKDMSKIEFENFSKQYYLAYREDNVMIRALNRLINTFCEKFNLDSKIVAKDFWKAFSGIDNVTVEDLVNYLAIRNIPRYEQTKFLHGLWYDTFKETNTISLKNKHLGMFDGVTLDCIPETDEKHKVLKAKLSELYANGNFPLSTLANFYANADGVNLNDNNPNYYKEFKERIINEKVIHVPIEANISKSVPGPIGMPNYDMSAPFKFAPENRALLTLVSKLQDQNQLLASFNYHGTGGLVYFLPCYDTDKDMPRTSNTPSFYVNSLIATEYSNTIGEVYKKMENTDKDSKELGYRYMGYPDRITGIGDLMRKKSMTSLLVELSKMGGNPLSPYGDKNGNYMETMVSNFEALSNSFDSIYRYTSVLYDTQKPVMTDRRSVKR